MAGRSGAHRIECYRVAAGEYSRVILAEEEVVLTHPEFPGLAIPLADLWR